MADTQAGGAPKLVRAIVAPGRTIVIGGGPVTQQVNGKVQTVGFTMGKSVGPHQEVELPLEEVVRHRANGTLIDPDKVIAVAASSAVVRR